MSGNAWNGIGGLSYVSYGILLVACTFLVLVANGSRLFSTSRSTLSESMGAV